MIHIISMLFLLSISSLQATQRDSSLYDALTKEFNLNATTAKKAATEFEAQSVANKQVIQKMINVFTHWRKKEIDTEKANALYAPMILNRIPTLKNEVSTAIALFEEYRKIIVIIDNILQNSSPSYFEKETLKAIIDWKSQRNIYDKITMTSHQQAVVSVLAKDTNKRDFYGPIQKIFEQFFAPLGRTQEGQKKFFNDTIYQLQQASRAAKRNRFTELQQLADHLEEFTRLELTLMNNEE